MALDLVAVYYLSSIQVVSLTLVFLTGAISFAAVAPIQMLMINTAVGAEMIASAAIQAAFNIGNALGAFLGGLPLVAGFSFASPNLVGTAMALSGVILVFIFIQYRKKVVKLQTIQTT